MKKYLKLLTIIVIAFVMMVGINVNAEDDIYLCSNGASIEISVPIHKTDSNKKALKGAIFTLKDFNNSIAYSSSDEGDGDYLIEVRESSYNYFKYASSYCGESVRRQADSDLEYRVIDGTKDDDVLTEILNVIPTKYSDVFRKAEDEDDFSNMLDLPLAFLYDYADYSYQVGFYVPIKVEETKVPAGYKAKDIVVPAFVYLSFNYGNISAYLSYTPGYSYYGPFEMVPAYFEYKEGTDYEAIFDKINKGLSKYEYVESDNLLDVFADNGAIVDDDCEIDAPKLAKVAREDLELRDVEEKFSSDVEELLCPINLVDEKEDIIVNPETAGTIGIVTLLIVIGSAVVMGTRKVKNN